jgi:peptide deformylase
MARILQIAQLGHPILRECATPVDDLRCSETQDLVDDLIATVVDAAAAGIAAPQVYISKSVFIVSSTPSEKFPNRPEMDPTPVINPAITFMSKNTDTFWEGCLSVPGVGCLVPRATTIRIAYTTREGERVEREYSDYVARVFQHEYDHLEGTIFFDRIENNRDIIMEKEFLKLQLS